MALPQVGAGSGRFAWMISGIEAVGTTDVAPVLGIQSARSRETLPAYPRDLARRAPPQG